MTKLPFSLLTYHDNFSYDNEANGKRKVDDGKHAEEGVVRIHLAKKVHDDGKVGEVIAITHRDIMCASKGIVVATFSIPFQVL